MTWKCYCCPYSWSPGCCSREASWISRSSFHLSRWLLPVVLCRSRRTAQCLASLWLPSGSSYFLSVLSRWLTSLLSWWTLGSCSELRNLVRQSRSSFVSWTVNLGGHLWKKNPAGFCRHVTWRRDSDCSAASQSGTRARHLHSSKALVSAQVLRAFWLVRPSVRPMELLGHSGLCGPSRLSSWGSLRSWLPSP